ncbi:MAG: asparagine synthase (glutamine-hydrolyzing) [Acidobacteriota bacterium]|nr:asparagine synthase (glutamine-hydrolyzing) [Acidobacteriota bacterium]
MCGIAGFTHFERTPSPGAIQRATETLRHRGPDQLGVYESRDVSLGAVRLAIVDVAHGDQPMRTSDGAYAIVFNGEIYNHAELRAELEALGHVFRTKCDTEVVLHAFAEWDVNCFERLRGMFAAAFLDERRRRLILVRDRLGIKPLYYMPWRGNLFFGSELKAIFAHSHLPRQICSQALSYFLSLNYIPGPFTLIEGLWKLEPGTWLEFQHGEIVIRKYWHNVFRPEAIHPEDARQELNGLLTASVKEHLMGDMPVGLWLSGGLDSSTMLHYAAQHSSRPVQTFSISFKGRSCDESQRAQSLAQHYGAAHHELDLNTDLDLASAIHDIAYHSYEQSADAGALPVWFLSQLTAEKVKVTLSGEGADEIFGGYQTYLADQYARGARIVPEPLLKFALRAAELLPVSDEKISLEYKIKRFLGGSLLPADQAHFFWNGTFSHREQRDLRAFEQIHSLDSLAGLPGLPSHREVLNRCLFLDQHYYLPDDILYKCDRMSMAHSLEVRPPFLDHRIVEFAGRLPVNLKIRGSQTKYVLRTLMKTLLPASAVRRKKEGLDIPTHEWLRGPLRPLMEDALGWESVNQAGLFAPQMIDRLVNRHLERRANLGYHLWGLITLHLWMHRWKVETGGLLDASGDRVFATAAG